MAVDITNDHRCHTRLVFYRCCWLTEHIALPFICVYTLLIWESFVSIVMEVSVWVCVCAAERTAEEYHILSMGSQL